jgi:hypothetical protein
MPAANHAVENGNGLESHEKRQFERKRGNGL